MSKRKAKHRKPKRPTTDRERRQSAVEAMTARLREPTALDDPFSGIPPALMDVAIAVGRVRAKPWHWNPGREVGRGEEKVYVQPSPEIGVRDTRGTGWTSAHAGTVSDPLVQPEDALANHAQLTADEREVFRLQGERLTQQEIANRLGTTRARVRGLQATAWRKLAEVGEALRQLGTAQGGEA